MVALAMLLSLSWCVKAQAMTCETSAQSILAKGAPHARWRLIGGRKCWFAGYPSATRIGALPSPKPRLTRQSDRTSVSPPLLPPAWHQYTQEDVDAAWRRYDRAQQQYDRAAMFLNLLLFGTLCPQRDQECSFGGPRR
jgi:hypothetical protein